MFLHSMSLKRNLTLILFLFLYEISVLPFYKLSEFSLVLSCSYDLFIVFLGVVFFLSILFCILNSFYFLSFWKILNHYFLKYLLIWLFFSSPVEPPTYYIDSNTVPSTIHIFWLFVYIVYSFIFSLLVRVP